MTLKSYQQEILLNTLYAIQATGTGNGDCLQPFMEVIGGVANVYGSSEFAASPPTGMTNAVSAGLQGIEVFAAVPNYLFVTQASGTITKVILSGVKAVVATS